MEETTFFSRLGVNLFFCFWGLMGYTLFSVRNHLKDFNKDKFWNENKMFWLWAILSQLLYASLMAYVPELEYWISNKMAAILDTASGMALDIPKTLVNTVIYLTLTWQLSRVANKAVKPQNKIGTKKQK